MFLEKTQLPIAQLGKILEALFLDGNVSNKSFPWRKAPSLMKTLSMGRDASSPHTASWKVVYMSLYIQYLSQETYKIRRIPQKFCADSVQILQSFCAANSGIAVLLPQQSVSHFCRMILRCPRNDAVHGFVLKKLTSSFFMERLYCIRIWCTSFTLVSSNNNGLIIDT